MHSKRIFLCTISNLFIASAINVDVQGSLRLGRDVFDKISYYFPKGNHISARRSIPDDNSDLIADEVKSSFLCRNLAFCHNEFKKNINEYVIALIKAVNSIIDEALIAKENKNLTMTRSFNKNLRNILHDVREILKQENKKLKDDNETYIWITIIKSISGLFMIKSETYVLDALVIKDKDKDVSNMKKTLIQKVIGGIAETEINYQSLFCKSSKICIKSVDCSKVLTVVLEHLIEMPENKTQVFMKSLTELFRSFNFYSLLEQATATEFQIILHDMAFTNHVPSKEILKSVRKAVDSRLMSTDLKDNTSLTYPDILLIYIILSDVDFLFSRQNPNPYDDFLHEFLAWVQIDIQIHPYLKKLLNKMQDDLKRVPQNILTKLKYEVKVFFELTVDPETS
ncbi:hypothetical protein ACJJTC_019695 [Scirpophaga incertulas]